MPKLKFLCCNKYLKPKCHLPAVPDARALHILKKAFNSSLTIKAKICDVYRCYATKKIRFSDTEKRSTFHQNESDIKQPNGNQPSLTTVPSASINVACPSDPQKIKHPIRRCKTLQSLCIVCNSESNRLRIKPRAALRMYIDTGNLIPPNVRGCACHLDDNGFLLKTAMD